VSHTHVVRECVVVVKGTMFRGYVTKDLGRNRIQVKLVSELAKQLNMQLPDTQGVPKQLDTEAKDLVNGNVVRETNLDSVSLSIQK
jgi:hypothetical protein